MRRPKGSFSFSRTSRQLALKALERERGGEILRFFLCQRLKERTRAQKDIRIYIYRPQDTAPTHPTNQSFIRIFPQARRRSRRSSRAPSRSRPSPSSSRSSAHLCPLNSGRRFRDMGQSLCCLLPYVGQDGVFLPKNSESRSSTRVRIREKGRARCSRRRRKPTRFFSLFFSFKKKIKTLSGWRSRARWPPSSRRRSRSRGAARTRSRHAANSWRASSVAILKRMCLFQTFESGSETSSFVRRSDLLNIRYLFALVLFQKFHKGPSFGTNWTHCSTFEMLSVGPRRRSVRRTSSAHSLAPTPRCGVLQRHYTKRSPIPKWRIWILFERERESSLKQRWPLWPFC